MPCPVNLSHLEDAYRDATVATRTSSLDAALDGEKGETLNAICEVIGRLPSDLGWAVQVSRSDGGIQQFELYHVVGGQLVWVRTFQLFEEQPFDNVIDMAFWLNVTSQTVVLSIANDDRVQAALRAAAGGM